MAPQAIRELLDAAPFKPFHLRLPDGEMVPVATNDHAQLSPSGRRLVVFSDDDRMRIIDPILIAEMEVVSPEA